MYRQHTRHMLMAALLLAGWALPGACPQPAQAAAGLRHDALTRGPAPIPPAERALQSVTAQPWFKVPGESRVLEGAVFDGKGNLLFCDVTGRRVLRLTPSRELSTVVTLEDMAPGGLAWHPDGRLFMATLNLDKGVGGIVALPAALAMPGTGTAGVGTANAVGTAAGAGTMGAGTAAAGRPATAQDVQTIMAPQAGYLPNDLVFDAAGGFYFSDFKGTATEPRGGVYYVAPNFSTITPVLPGLAQANGVALSPDGATLWATEFGRNLLHRVELASATTIGVIGSAVPYHFTGPAPDSMRVDQEGNVYVALYGQGRVMAFNSRGIPLGQILLPGREQGRNLLSTSLGIRPGTRELYAVTGNATGAEGAAIFRAQVFGKGLSPAHAR